jgi:hypothetical protein
MTRRSILYVGTVTVVGLALLVLAGAIGWESADPQRFALYLGLAVLASTFKLHLPGLTGTMSENFLYILIGVAQLSLSETVVLAALATLVQCGWRPRRRPKLVQVLFNVAVLAISAALAHRLSHWALGPIDSLPLLLSVATSILFLANTALVSAVIALVENRPLAAVWRSCYMWSFPYYMAGAVVAGVIVQASATAGWRAPLLTLPILVLGYVYYKFYLNAAEQRQAG